MVKQDSVLVSSYNLYFPPISTFLLNFMGKKFLRLFFLMTQVIRENPQDRSGKNFLIVQHLSSSYSSKVFKTF